MFKKNSSKIPEYSFRAVDSYRKEEAIVYRRIAIIGFLTAIVLGIVFLWGISFVYGLGSFWEVFRGKKADVATNQTNIYRSINPKLDRLPSATNKDRINVSGSVANGLTVELFVNNNLYGKVVSNESRFSFSDVKIKLGENTLKVVAKDEQEASEPALATIVYEKTPPKLTVNEISNEVIYLDKQREIQISGTTDNDATVTINDFQAIVYPDGNFSYGLPLHVGQNNIKVTATDKAGNQTTIEKSVLAEESANPVATGSATPSGLIQGSATTSASSSSEQTSNQIQIIEDKKKKDKED